MLSFRPVAIALVSAMACGLVGIIRLCSYMVTMHCARTVGTSHCQLTVSAGRLILIHNAPWWRVEHFCWELERTGPGSPVDWPGFSADTRRQRLGCEFASGDYLTAFTPVGRDTEFIPPFQPVKPGTMLRVTTKFKMYVIPLWLPMLLTGVVPVRQIWLKMRRGSRHPVVHIVGDTPVPT